MKTQELIMVYKVVGGKLISKEIKPNELKYNYGWKKDVDEALQDGYNNHQYHLANEIHTVNKRIEVLLDLKDKLKNMGIELAISDKNNHGVSLDGIDEVVNNLLKLTSR